MLIMDHSHAVQMNALKVVGIRSMNDSFMLSSMEQYCIVGQVSIIQVIAFLFDLHYQMQLYRCTGTIIYQ